MRIRVRLRLMRRVDGDGELDITIKTKTRECSSWRYSSGLRGFQYQDCLAKWPKMPHTIIRFLGERNKSNEPGMVSKVVMEEYGDYTHKITVTGDGVQGRRDL